MKAIRLEKDNFDFFQIFNFARSEPVLLLMNGEEFILSRADDFDAEVESLRNNSDFQNFLDERMKCKVRFPIEEVEKEILV
jgi:hypothetical protein